MLLGLTGGMSVSLPGRVAECLLVLIQPFRVLLISGKFGNAAESGPTRPRRRSRSDGHTHPP